MSKAGIHQNANNIGNLLHEAGILQFGRFTDGETFSPLNLNFDFLPSYPDILYLLAQLTEERLKDLHVDRLASTADSVPLAVAVGLRTNLPVIYSRGGKLPPVYDLIGAYDIGHPAVLIAHTPDDPSIPNLINSARRVGLEIHTLIAVLDTGKPYSNEIPVRTLLCLEDVVNHLRRSHHLPQGQAQEIFNWAGKAHPD